MATPTYDPIASTTLTSSASSVTFSSLDTIAAGYRDLVLVLEVFGNGGNTAPYIRLNGVTSSIYNSVYALGNGSSASSSSASIDWLDWTPISGGATTPVQGQVQFIDFAATDKHKSWLSRANRADAGTAMVAGRFASTSAITTILIYAAGANAFASGSTFSLYGIAA